MKIAFVGMGKLGFPCALAAASRGHDVVGFDVSPAAKKILTSRWYPHREREAQELLEATSLEIVDSIAEAVAHADIVFIAVQTPHQPEFEGITRMPDARADFDYTALKAAVRAVAEAAEQQKKRIAIVVISTCLPGTCDREIRPLLNDWVGFVYNPFFIAMGTTIADYFNPEFVLLGADTERAQNMTALDVVRRFYRELHARPAFGFNEGETTRSVPHAVMSVTSAELTKVAYNVFLGLKIVAANSIMEIAHKVGANCDDVTLALAKATDRVVSARYMRGGMGDGGGCHPRDQIALSWLARKLGLSYDLFGAMILAREAQTQWLAELAMEESRDGKLPIVILGKAYKKGTNLTIGSPATLLKSILDEYPHLEVHQWDPHVDGEDAANRYVSHCPTFEELRLRAVYIIATDHDQFYAPTVFPLGSVVIDPWGKMGQRYGVKVILVGRNCDAESAALQEKIAADAG